MLGRTCAYLHISLGLVGDFHQEFCPGVHHVLENILVNAEGMRLSIALIGYTMGVTHTAPKLSELETKRYSLPSDSSWSRTPE